MRILLMACAVAAVCVSGCSRGAPDTADKAEAATSSGKAKAIELNEMDFKAQTAQGVALVDFWAPWCGPCRMVAPVLEKLAADHGDKVAVVKVNVDENQELAARYGIMSIPTVMMFEGGQQKAQLIGARSQKDYEAEFGLA